MADRPNLVFVFADQMRAEAMGCMGNEQVQTPTLDALADEGLLFTRAYASNPVCSPARASILTGRYPHRNRVVGNHLRLPTTERSVADCFLDAGYETGYVGKWHLDGEHSPGFVPPGPRRQGFEHWEGFNKGHDHLKGHPRVEADGTVVWEEGYQPAVQTDLALDFVEAHRDDPFCLFLSWGPPHTPFRAPEEYGELYDADALDLRPNVPEEMAADVRSDLVEYYGMVTSLDEQLGRLVERLDALGLAGETVLCFTSDHGEMMGSQGRMYKGVPFEESIHVPLVLRYPDRIDGGRRSDAVVSHVDYLPTLAALCDVPVPDGVQGRDLTRSVLGAEDAPTSAYVEGKLTDDDTWRALRTEEYLLTVGRDLEVRHLFDVRRDPYQQRNLAGERRRQLEEDLRARLLDAAYEYDDRYVMSRDISQRRPLLTELDQRRHPGYE